MLKFVDFVAQRKKGMLKAAEQRELNKTAPLLLEQNVRELL